MSHDADVFVNEDAYANVMFRDYGDTTAKEEYAEPFFYGKSEEKMVSEFAEADKVGLQGLLLEFAQFCLANRITILDDYNSWLAFGANCKRVFDKADDAIAVWDACSYYSAKYENDCCDRKYSQLPSATYVGAIGQIYNLFKNNYPNLADTYNIKNWLLNTRKKYGLL